MKNSYFILGTFLIIIFSLMIGTVIKVQEEHLRRNLLVVEKRIVESALECVYDNHCEDKDMTLGLLIEKGYAKEEVNPKTKMYYSHDSLLKKENNTFIFEGF